MNIFKSTRFTWWQLGLLKWAVLFIGIAAGATWPELLAPYALILLAIGLVISLYLGVVWLHNK
jgi:hypothetical protein